MTHGRSPNYIITKDFEDLPVGAFIRPINPYYVPAQTMDRLGLDAKYLDVKTHAICYTAKGMKVIPTEIIKEVK